MFLEIDASVSEKLCQYVCSRSKPAYFISFHDGLAGNESLFWRAAVEIEYGK